MNDELMHDVVGNIYDTSLSPERWPELIRGITLLLSHSAEFDRCRNHIEKIDDGDETHQFENTSFPIQAAKLLNVHFERALKISGLMAVSDEQKKVLHRLFDYLALPVIVIDRNRAIVYANTALDDYLSRQPILNVSGGTLEIRDGALSRAIGKGIQTVIEQCCMQTVSLGLPGTGFSPSIAITPLLNDEKEDPQYLVLMVCSHQEDHQIDDEKMMALYQITSAETRLINHLIQGKTLKEVSESTHLSMHTLRSQLRSIFTKTGISRQPELVRCMLLHSNFLQDRVIRMPAQKANMEDHANIDQAIVLDDGRKMAFAEYGDPEGKVVIGFHPFTGSRYQAPPDQEITANLGIRLIIPDRPGFGRSDPLEHRAIRNYSRDISQLMDQLNIARATMLSYCGGTPYAINAAIDLPDRVSKLILVSPVTPYERIDVLQGITTPNRMLANIAVHLPESLFKLTHFFARGIVRAPEKYFDDVIAHLCETDAFAMNEPKFMDDFTGALSECLAQGPQQFAYEQILLANDWDLDFNQVSCPTEIWHGQSDKHVPVEYVKKFASQFDGAKLHLIPDYGHFLIYYFWRHILEEVG